MSRIVLDVSGEEHQKIKTLAVLQGKTIKDYVLGKVFSDNVDEDEAMKTLQSLLSERIEDAERESYAGKSFSQIAQEAIQNRHDV